MVEYCKYARRLHGPANSFKDLNVCVCVRGCIHSKIWLVFIFVVVFRFCFQLLTWTLHFMITRFGKFSQFRKKMETFVYTLSHIHTNVHTANEIRTRSNKKVFHTNTNRASRFVHLDAFVVYANGPHINYIVYQWAFCRAKVIALQRSFNKKEQVIKIALASVEQEDWHIVQP